MQNFLLAQKCFAAFCIFTLLFVTVSCSIQGNPNTFLPTIMEYPKAEVVIQSSLSEPLPEGYSLYLEIVDDVTGIYFNASRHAMAALDDLHYYIRIPAMISSELKYRFVRIKNDAQYESNPLNQAVRFRMARVNGPIIIHDEISGWLNETYAKPSGSITGQVFDKDTNTPIPNLLIVAGGFQTITASDGTFLLEKVSPGTHNLVIYSLDGEYETFQQDAAVAVNAMTPVQAGLARRKSTNITFTVKIPDDYNYDPTLPLRFISNLHSLGNAYADLEGGSSGNALNYPVMKKIDDQLYTIELSLPIGMHLRYKYSFGDGLWNSELNGNGSFMIRDLLVSKNDNQKDQITTFLSPGKRPVLFNLLVPANTPPEETMTIQLNPFGWMEPLPMVQIGTLQWKYVLYSPPHLLNEIEYRFCRNGICVAGQQEEQPAGQFMAGIDQLSLSTTLETWSDLSSPGSFTVLTDYPELHPRPDFMAGVELIPNLPGFWVENNDSTIKSITHLGADWVVFSPTWSLLNDDPIVFEPQPGQDLLWDQMSELNSRLKTSGLDTILFPKINYTQSINNLFTSHQDDDSWNQDWFVKYTRFILQSADFASTQSIPYMMVGDPALNLAGVTTDDWLALIEKIRSRYKGKIIGVSSIFENSITVPSWVDHADLIYVIYSPSLHAEANTSTIDFVSIIESSLDANVLPISQNYKKPVIIGLAVPSSLNGLNGTTDQDYLNVRFQQIEESVQPDNTLQAKIYNAALIAAAKKSWISGFLTSGYSPFRAVSDVGYSIYAKPASDAMWFWYHYLLNK